jgi:hypothetical protein
MPRPSAEHAVDVAQRLRAANRRVAWTLASIAAVFFAGIIATRVFGGGTIGIGVMGTVVLLFLVIAIGRNLRRSDERAGESASATDASARKPAGSRLQQRDSSGQPGEVQR